MKRMCVLTMAFLVATMLLPTAALAADPELTVGMIYISPVQIPWSAAHQTGFKQALDAIFGVGQQMTVVADGEGFKVVNADGEEVVKTLSWTATTDFSATAAAHAAEDMILKGVRLIFVTAENWCQDINDNLAPKYPNVNFACIRGPVAKNLISMYPKSWEGFCAACAGAAAIVDEPNLGMLGAYENNPQVASNHGACAKCFADAWAENHTSTPNVATVYINNWASPDEATGAESLAAAGSKVVAVHQDSTAAAVALSSVTPRVWVIGYDRDWAKFTSPNGHVLTSVTIDWMDVYSTAIQSTLAGTFEGFKWNPGLETTAVQLSPFSPEAPAAAKETADKYAQKLIEGWRPCGTDDDMWAMDSYKKCYTQ